MAAGATISGQVRVTRLTVDGNEFIVAGPYSSLEADQANYENRLFHNIAMDGAVRLGNIRAAPAARFLPGEVLRVQHLSASLAESFDHDADEYEIGILRRDLNTGVVRPGTLTVGDTGLSADASTSTTVWVTLFTYTVPDRQEIGLKGPFKAAAVEVA